MKYQQLELCALAIGLAGLQIRHFSSKFHIYSSFEVLLQGAYHLLE
jgi:hypothetical protein